MARPQSITAMQFSDRSTGGKIAVTVAGVAGVVAGLILPRWITALGILVVFLVGFVVLKLRQRI